MLPQRRHEQILHALRVEGPVAVAVLAERLCVSEATVRRDLARLARSGLLTRVHGGAAPSPGAEQPFPAVAVDNLPDKDAIAHRAVELVRDGDALLLDVGTTTLQLARRLRGRSVTVMTSNLAVYEELADDAGIELILLGGVVRRNYRSLVGFLTEETLRQVRAERLFLGTSGVRGDGSVMDTTLVEVPVKRAMIEAADQVVLLADPGKFPGSGLARVCGPRELDVVVTRASSDGRTLAVLRDAGVEVVEA